jgi:hypothetical protein
LNVVIVSNSLIFDFDVEFLEPAESQGRGSRPYRV